MVLQKFVDEQDQQVNLGVVLGDGVGDLLQQDRLAGFGLGYDQAALAFANGRKQVEHAHVGFGSAGLDVEVFVGIERREVVEALSFFDGARHTAVDFVDLDECKEAFAFFGRAHLAVDGVAQAQAEAFDLGG